MVRRVSSRGQVTLPAAMRRRLGIRPDSEVEVVERAGEVAIRPLKRVGELAGILSRYASPDGPGDWDAIRERTEQAVAEEVADARARRLPRRR